MTLKRNPIVAALLIVGIILLFVLFKGCQYNKELVAKNNKLNQLAIQLDSINNAALQAYTNSNAEFKDSLEFERGQKELIKAQKERTEDELARLQPQIKELLEKHKLAKYQDTTAVTVPQEYITDCEGCFTKLEQENNLVNRYKNDINSLQNNWDKQNQLYQKQFKALDQERLGFYNKINSLAQQQQKELDKLKPHGRLYLSWGVVWKPFPWAAGAGLMYQNKYNLLLGAKWYYGSQGHMIETTINFPLSIKLR